MAKLVRDKIRDIIIEKGQTPIGHFCKAKELKSLLAQKLMEEAHEFSVDRVEEELADVQEVVDTIYEVYGFSKASVRKVQEKKRRECGGFTKGYVLEGVV